MEFFLLKNHCLESFSREKNSVDQNCTVLINSKGENSPKTVAKNGIVPFN
jgi:hypothetical protein